MLPVLALAVACAGPKSLVPGIPEAGSYAAAGALRSSVLVTIHVPPDRGPHALKSRRNRFVAASTRALQVLGYKPRSVHTKKTLLSSLVMTIGAGVKGCTTVLDGGLQCTGKIGVVPPAMDFEATTWDATPVRGKPAGKELAAASLLNHKILASFKNTIGITLGGIPASVAVALPYPSPVAGVQTTYIHGTSSSNTTVGVNAYDADGNLIVTDNYADASGGPQSIALGITPSASTCGSGDYLNPTGTPVTSLDLPAPVPLGITFDYGATAVAQIFSASAPCSFTLTASMPGIPSVPAVSAAITLLGPTLTTIPVTGKHGPSAPDGLAAGPGGQLWFADPGGLAVGYVLADSASPVPQEYEATSAGTPVAPYGIVQGTDGNMWFTEEGQVAQLGPLSPMTPPSVYALPTPAGVPQIGEQIANGPADKLEWYTGANVDFIYSMGAGGHLQNAFVAASPNPAAPTGIISWLTEAGAYELWIANEQGNTIEAINPDGTPIAGNTNQVVATLTGTSMQPQFIAADGTGNFWFTSATQHSINELVPFKGGAGAVTSFVVPNPASEPWGLGLGPDGAMWFADLGTHAIGRIPLDATSASQITEYTISSTSLPKWVLTDFGALWFTDASGSIDELTY